jgi:SAM-dependent methyltransferase
MRFPKSSQALIAMISTPSTPSQPKHASEKSVAQRQFTRPQGLIGRIVGWVMAGENRHMNQMAIDWLDVGPGDDVLEIGFGPGHALELLVERTAARTIAGIDLSPVMIEQAVARNRQAIDAGRVSLALGSVDALPFADGQFSRVMAVSNFHIWPSRELGLREIYRVLRDGGKLVLCARRALESPWPWSSPGVSAAQLRKDQSLLEDCGFRDVYLATRKGKRRLACLVAAK